MQNINKSAETLADGILKSIKQAIKDEASYDVTFKARVIGKVGTNKYNVIYKNTAYTVTSNDSLVSDQIVNVVAPKNNWSDLIVLSSGNNSNSSSDGTGGTVSDYILPIAQTNYLGGVKIGNTISITSSGTINIKDEYLMEGLTNEELDALLE